jgi:hypothetical protein
MTALRTLFALLIAGNLLLALANLGGFSHAPGGEPERLSSQLHPEKLRLLKVSEADEKKPSEPATPAAEPDASASAAPAASTSPAAATADAACVRWTGLTQAQADELGEKAKAAGLKSSTESTTTPNSWWVHLPQQPDRAGAEKKAGELQRLGVTEYFIDPNNAVSLGLYKSEEAAKRALDQLKGKGVQTARIDVRGTSSLALELSGAQNLVTGLANEAAGKLTGAQRASCAH